MYEVVLVSNEDGTIRTYDSNIEPIAGDYILISESQSFKVDKRLLPFNDSNRIILMGSIVKNVIK